jgi:hypothetical protein
MPKYNIVVIYMPNDCWGIIQMNGTNALKAWNKLFLNESLEDIQLIQKKENFIEFKYYSAWKPNTELICEVSKTFGLDIIYDYSIEYGMAGEGVLYFCNGDEVINKKRKYQ